MSISTDRAKIETAVAALLQEVIDSGKTICFFDLNDFCASLKLSHLRKSDYHNTVSDTLTGTDIHHTYGDWVTGEYECSTRYLVQLAKAGETQSVCDGEKNHFAQYGKSQVYRGKRAPVLKTLEVDVPEDATPEEIAEIFRQRASSVEKGELIFD